MSPCADRTAHARFCPNHYAPRPWLRVGGSIAVAVAEAVLRAVCFPIQLTLRGLAARYQGV